MRYGTRLAMAGGLRAVGAATIAVLGPMGLGRAVTQQLAPAPGPVTFTGREGAPALSSDGGHLAYVSNESATRTLMVQSLNGWPAPGEPPVPVFSAPEFGHLRWAPDGSELLVWARGPEHNGVYALPRMGGAPRLIAARQYIACWSPDGSTVAVGSYLDGTSGSSTGSGESSAPFCSRGCTGPSWTLTVRRHQPARRRQQRLPGSLHDLDRATGRYRSTAHDLGESGGLLGAPDAGRERRLLPAAREPDGHAAEAGAVTWGGHGQDPPGRSRDGPILRRVRRRPTARLYPRAVSLQSLDRRCPPGSDPATLETTQLTTGTSLIERPRVSPDGLSMVFNVGREPRTDLFTMPLAGGTPTRLTFLEALNVAGGWSADGRQIAFASTQDGRPRVWVVDAAGGVPRAVSSGALSDSLDVSWSPGSRILYQQAETATITSWIPRPARKRCWQGRTHLAGCSRRRTRRTGNKWQCFGTAGRIEASGSSTWRIAAPGSCIKPTQPSAGRLDGRRTGAISTCSKAGTRATGVLCCPSSAKP